MPSVTRMRDKAPSLESSRQIVRLLKVMIIIGVLVSLAPFIMALRPKLPVHPYLVISVCMTPWIVWVFLAINIYENARAAAQQPSREGRNFAIFLVSIAFCVITELVAGFAVSPIGQPFLSGRLGGFIDVAWGFSFFYLNCWACLWLATSVSRMVNSRFHGIIVGVMMAVGLCLPLFFGLFEFPRNALLYHMPGWFLLQAIGYVITFSALLSLNLRVLACLQHETTFSLGTAEGNSEAATVDVDDRASNGPEDQLDTSFIYRA